MKTTNNIKPIYDTNSQILILGSIPSVTSRKQEFYYAHPQNRFWKIFEIIFNVQLNSIEEKKEFLLKNHIALWDVISSCQIIGSSDSTIKNIKYNNYKIITKQAHIKAIFCTGNKSYQLFTKKYQENIPIIYLPSPSSANATYKLDDLVKEYKKVLNYLD